MEALPDEADTAVDIWGWFASFPYAEPALNIVLALNIFIFILIVLWRRNATEMTKVSIAIPMAIYGLAWIFRWVAMFTTGDISSAFFVFFSVFILISLIWSVVNLYKIARNIR